MYTLYILLDHVRCELPPRHVSGQLSGPAVIPAAVSWLRQSVVVRTVAAGLLVAHPVPLAAAADGLGKPYPPVEHPTVHHSRGALVQRLLRDGLLVRPRRIRGVQTTATPEGRVPLHSGAGLRGSQSLLQPGYFQPARPSGGTQHPVQPHHTTPQHSILVFSFI